MKQQILAMIVASAMLVPASVASQEMLAGQGCGIFDLVEDLGSVLTPFGNEGRWLVSNIVDGTEMIYAFEAIDLVPPLAGPTDIAGTTFVAWEFEGTGIRGTKRSTFEGSFDPDTFHFSLYFEGEAFRGNRYSSGGISGTASGNLIAGFAYDEVRIVLCKSGLGGN